MDMDMDGPVESRLTIGLIGMGNMGKMYANLLLKAGWKRIHVCDTPKNYESLRSHYFASPNITVFPDGHGVSRSSDFIIYSVEAEHISSVVSLYGPSTKLGSIVAGQTSVKAPEKEAFEKYLPADVQIISIHSLHGPTVNPKGQPLVIINHRGTEEGVERVERILSSFGSRFVRLSYEEHDEVTANTQAVTHAAFLSMGTAWSTLKSYPWEQGFYTGGIETVKVNLTLRIYSNAWHVYAGLAILNPKARKQISQYARSASDLFGLMITNDEPERKLRERVEWAKRVVFGDDTTGSSDRPRRTILLSQELLDKFSLGIPPPSPSPGRDDDTSHRRPNSHLSLLAMVDCWAHLNIKPYLHLSLAATPLFRLFLGVSEYLFSSPTLLSSSIHSAVYDTWHRRDDLEFVVAARGWSECVKWGDFEVYKKRFEETRGFFEGRFEEAGQRGSEMIKAVMESESQV